jgi:hypothetical protein
MTNRAGRDRILMSTRTAFIQGAGPSGPVNLPALRSLTLGADKSVRPSLLIEVILTDLLGPESVLPLDQRHHTIPPRVPGFSLNLTYFPPLKGLSPDLTVYVCIFILMT